MYLYVIYCFPHFVLFFFFRERRGTWRFVISFLYYIRLLFAIWKEIIISVEKIAVGRINAEALLASGMITETAKKKKIKISLFFNLLLLSFWFLIFLFVLFSPEICISTYFIYKYIHTHYMHVFLRLPDGGSSLAAPAIKKRKKVHIPTLSFLFFLISLSIDWKCLAWCWWRPTKISLDIFWWKDEDKRSWGGIK